MTNVITSVTSIFTAMGQWIADALQALEPIFYTAESGLTFLGTLAICGLSVSVVMLIMNIIKDFLNFR